MLATNARVEPNIVETRIDLDELNVASTSVLKYQAAL
jgi:hypothetical protein